MRRDRSQATAAGKRLALQFGFLLVAFLVGDVTGSFGAFVALMALGVIVSLSLMATSAFTRK